MLVHQLLVVLPPAVLLLLRRRPRRRKRVSHDIETRAIAIAKVLTVGAEKEESDEDMGFGLFD